MSCESSFASGESSNSGSYTESVTGVACKKTLKFDRNSTVNELNCAIDECKAQLLDKDVCSEERIWFVRHIVELRLRVQEINDAGDMPVRVSVSTMGHRFRVQVACSVNSTQYCDHCGGAVWNIIKGSYACEDCGFTCHMKCVNDIRRTCAHVTLAEKGDLEMNICPERGLDFQLLRCAECHAQLLSRAGKMISEPRLCDYSGLYYCAVCHWNDKLPIPARVIHNWDWSERPVARVSYQLLRLAFSKPIIDISKSNSSIYKFVAELSWIQEMRKSLLVMLRYLSACRTAIKNDKKLIREIVSSTAVHKYYSMAQLQATRDGTLENHLSLLLETARVHITQCEQCLGCGYICEICGNNQVIFPFDSGVVPCEKCNSLYHKNCWTRKGQTCLKCKRVAERQAACQGSQDDPEEIDPHQWTEEHEQFL